MSNRDIGLDALRKFYDYQKFYFGSGVGYSFDDLLNYYGKKKEIYLEGVGDMIVNGAVTNSRLDTALLALAKDSKGSILKNPVQISNYIQNQEAKIDWIDASVFVLKESATTVLEGAAELGNSIISTAKILNFLLPLIALIFVYYWINSKTKGQASKALNGLRK